jgi:hypothetical protein
MGKIAIPTWSGRVSSVFDTASRLLVVEVGEEGECSRFETDITENFLPSKIMRLTGLGVDTLICGAISRPSKFKVQKEVLLCLTEEDLEWEGAGALEEVAYPEVGPIGPQGLCFMPLMEDMAINGPILLMVCGWDTGMVILISKKVI